MRAMPALGLLEARFRMAFQKSLAHTFMDLGWGEEAASLLQKTVDIEERTGADELQATLSKALEHAPLRF